MKAYHKGPGVSHQSWVLSCHFGRDKMVAMLGVSRYFPHLFRVVADIIKYYDLYRHVNINC